MLSVGRQLSRLIRRPWRRPPHRLFSAHAIIFVGPNRLAHGHDFCVEAARVLIDPQALDKVMRGREGMLYVESSKRIEAGAAEQYTLLSPPLGRLCSGRIGPHR